MTTLRLKVTHYEIPLKAPFYNARSMTLAEVQAEDRERRKKENEAREEGLRRLHHRRDQKRRQQNVIDRLLGDGG
jgi:hypothetical protein